MSVTAPETQPLRRLPVRRMLAVTPLVAIALGAAVMGARARVPDNQIAAGVRVGELDLGGKTVEEARPLLEQWAVRKQGVQLSLSCPADAGVDKTWKPDAAKLGLGVNVASTLDAAAKAGRTDLAGQVGQLFSGAKKVYVPAVPTTDDARLKAYLKRQIAADVNRMPKNARFVLIPGGGFGTHREEIGRAVDVDASASAVKQAWSSYLAAIPAATPSSAATPPTGQTGDKTGSDKTGDDKTSADKTAGDKTTDTAAAAPDKGGPDSQPAPGAAAEGPEAVLSILSTPAAITDADVSQIDGVLGAKTSYVNGTTARLGNIRIAARHINGTLLKPGDVFSYNKIVGPRGEDGGYRIAPILVQGKHETGIGGGICQTSGTLFNAVLASGLKIVERTHHSTPIGYLPVGLDATVSYGSLDLRFKNDTPAPVYVAATLNGRALTFSLFGKHVPGRKVTMIRGGYSRSGGSYETRHDSSKPAGYRRVVESGSGGGHVTWYRLIKENGKVVHRDVISSDYSGHRGVVVVGTGARKPRASKRSAPGAGAAPSPETGGGAPVPPADAPQL